MAPDTYYEVIGSVVNSTTVRMYHYVPMGPNLGEFPALWSARV